MKLPPYLMDPTGYCYAASPELAADRTLRPWRGKVSAAGYAVAGTEPPPPWAGETVVCIASGPSLTIEDCALVRDSGLRAMAANDSWRRAPFVDVIYAMDPGWWEQHIHEIACPAQRWTTSVSAAKEFDLNFHTTHSRAHNSGAMMMELAAQLGAARLILLGYDCSIAAGTHWHGDHTRTDNPDAQTVVNWHQHFADVGRAIAGTTSVVNCSRQTEITCFPRANLAVELATNKSRKVKRNRSKIPVDR